MAIQSAINQMLGTAGTVSAIGQHLSQEKKNLKFQKEEAKFAAQSEAADLAMKKIEAETDKQYYENEEQAGLEANPQFGTPAFDYETASTEEKANYRAIERYSNIVGVKAKQIAAIDERIKILEDRANGK